jgi:hypothetical protein
MIETSSPGRPPIEASDGQVGLPQIAQQIPQFYANAFVNHVSATEVTTLFTMAGRPVVAVSMAYSTARTYARLIEEACVKFEKDTGVPIPDLDVLIPKLAAAGE